MTDPITEINIILTRYATDEGYTGDQAHKDVNNIIVEYGQQQYSKGFEACREKVEEGVKRLKN